MFSSSRAVAIEGAILAVLLTRGYPHIVSAKEWVLKHYGADRLAADLRQLYLELLAQKGYVIEQGEDLQ